MPYSCVPNRREPEVDRHSCKNDARRDTNDNTVLTA